MAASQAEPVIARAFGGVIVQSTTAPGPASHDGLGRRFVFVPAAGDDAAYALDVESRQESMPAEIMGALGLSDEVAAFHRWTALEVEAKLTGVPVLTLLRLRPPPPPHVTFVRADTEHYWITVGKRI